MFEVHSTILELLQHRCTQGESAAETKVAEASCWWCKQSCVWLCFFEKLSSSFEKCRFPKARNVCVLYFTGMTWCIIWACCRLSFYYKSFFVWRTFRICRSSWTRRSPLREVHSFKNLSQDFHYLPQGFSERSKEQKKMLKKERQRQLAKAEIAKKR